MAVTLNSAQVNDVARRIGLSDGSIASLAQKAEAGACTLDDVKSAAIGEGRAAQYDACAPSFTAILGGASTKPNASTKGAGVQGLFASLVASKKADRGPERAQLLGNIVDNFAKLAYVKTDTQLFGIEDARFVVDAPAGTFSPDVTSIAKEVVAHPDVLSLADWTNPSSGLECHDRTNVQEEYARAGAMVQNRGEISEALNYLLKNFDDIAPKSQYGVGAMDRASLAACIEKLKSGSGEDQEIASTLSTVLNEGKQPFPPPCDLTAVLANASGNTSPNQLITRDGINALKDVINGKDLSVKQRDDDLGDRTDLLTRVVQQFDQLKSLKGPYLGPADLENIVKNPAQFAPDVVETARDLQKNLDLVALADSLSPRALEGQPTLDRLTDPGQYDAAKTLLAERKQLTAGIDWVIDNYESLEAKASPSTLTPENLRAAVAALPDGDIRKQALQSQVLDARYGAPVDFIDLMQNISGNNDGSKPAAISYESLFRLRSMLNSPLRGHEVNTVDVKRDGFSADELQLNGSAKLVNWLDYHGQTAPANAPDPRNKIRLTDDLGQAGSAFLKDPLPLADDDGHRTSFSMRTSFQMFDNKNGGADGITLTLASSPATLGGAGGGLGVWGSLQKQGAHSVSIEFDTHDNSADVHGDKLDTGNSINIKIDGRDDSEVSVPIPAKLNDGNVKAAWLDYDGERGVLEVRLADAKSNQTIDSVRPDKPTLSMKIDLPALIGDRANIGFTGGTGAASSVQDVFDLNVNAKVPVDRD
jgi:hypothetical protein